MSNSYCRRIEELERESILKQQLAIALEALEVLADPQNGGLALHARLALEKIKELGDE